MYKPFATKIQQSTYDKVKQVKTMSQEANSPIRLYEHIDKAINKEMDKQIVNFNKLAEEAFSNE